MDTVNVSDVKTLISKAHATLCILLHALDTKILVGEINRPSDPVTKIKRKRRTKKEMAFMPPIKMDLEKEYQADRIGPPLQKPLNLPDADANNPFYTKKKREKKEVIE